MANSPANFAGEIGIHYPLHVLNRYTLPELIGLAERALQIMGPFGFTRVGPTIIWNTAAYSPARPQS